MAEREFQNDDLPSPQEILDMIKRNKRYIIGGIGLLLVAIVAFSSYFQVEPEEEAVVLRFGAPLEETFGPGLHFKIPFVDQVHKVAVERQHRLEFGFRSNPGQKTEVRERGYEEESLMLTGDLQLVHVRWSLIYKIDEIKTWLFEVKDQENTIRDISKAVMRQLVGDYSLHEVLTVKIRELQQVAMRETQIALRDKVPTGVVITELSIRNTDVPAGARQAFEEFNRTEPDVRRELDQAKAAYDQVTADAEREKKRAVGQAEREYAQVTSNAEGEGKAFLDQWAEYKQAPGITKQWMYLQTMTRVLSGADSKLVLDSEGAAGSTLKLLPLTDMMKDAKVAAPAAATKGGAQ